MNDSRPLRCGACGRFISYADLESGLACRRLVTPDAEGTAETWETLCFPCIVEDREQQRSRDGRSVNGIKSFPVEYQYESVSSIDRYEPAEPSCPCDWHCRMREFAATTTPDDLRRDSVPVVDAGEAVK